MERFLVTVGLVVLLTIFLPFPDGMTKADTMNEENLALIIVSGYLDYSPDEVDKASDFRNYLLDKEFLPSNIRYLTKSDQNGSDGEATTGNVVDAISWLQSTSNQSREVVIYISDHVKTIAGLTEFHFTDGTISAETLDDMLIGVECAGMDIIINGARSGMGGAELSDSHRNVFCSMRSYQDYDPDYFNITRSLNDTTADLDLDGVVSFEEAFEREVALLKDTGQSPIKFI